MSTAWNASWCSLLVGAWPVMQIIGMESASAVYSPVIMLVPAGPEVPMQTPTFPVTRAQPSAAWVPPSSCRTVMCWMELCLQRGVERQDRGAGDAEDGVDALATP